MPGHPEALKSWLRKTERTKMSKKEIEKTQTHLPANTQDYGADANTGFEGQTREDLVIPFINIVQPNSKIAQESEKVRPGQFYNNVTEEALPSINLIPCYVDHLYVEWRSRKEGGGIAGRHQLDSEYVAKHKAASGGGNKIFTEPPNSKGEPQGNQIVETYYMYCVVLNAEGSESEGMVVVPFKSTNIRQYRKWNTKVNMFTLRSEDGRKVRPPLFAHRIKLSTTKEENPEGVWYNYQIESTNGDIKNSLIPPGHELLEEAKSLREMVMSGTAKAGSEEFEATATSDKAGSNKPF